MKPSALALWWHDAVCVGWNAPDRYCHGVSHLGVFRKSAEEVLASDNPATALHDRLCFIRAQHEATSGHHPDCPKPDRHAAELWAKATAQDALDFGGAA